MQNLTVPQRALRQHDPRQSPGPHPVHPPMPRFLLYPEVGEPLRADIRVERFRIQSRTVNLRSGDTFTTKCWRPSSYHALAHSARRVEHPPLPGIVGRVNAVKVEPQHCLVNERHSVPAVRRRSAACGGACTAPDRPQPDQPRSKFSSGAPGAARASVGDGADTPDPRRHHLPGEENANERRSVAGGDRYRAFSLARRCRTSCLHTMRRSRSMPA